MIARIQNTLPAHLKRRRTQFLRPRAFPSHLRISNLPIDFLVQPSDGEFGVKRPGKISERAGGCAAHGCRVAVANGINAACAGVQTADWASHYRRLALRQGFDAFIVPRKARPPAISIAEQSRGGEYVITSQRMAVMRVAELTTLISAATRLPRSLIVGPAPLDEESLLFHETVCRLAEYRAMIVHPTILHHPRQLRVIGKHYQFISMNYAEARIIEDGEQDIEKLACRARFLLDGASFAITNGSGRGVVWDENTWHLIEPCAVTGEICTVGAGDVWTAAYVLSKCYFGAHPNASVAYACIAAAASICRRPIPSY